MNASFLKRALYGIFVLATCLISSQFLQNGLIHSDWHDFDVFYYAARAALQGETIYVVVGQYNLPFWYFPWTAWLYIPFAVFPHNIALIIYKILFLLCPVLIIQYLTSYYNPRLAFLDKALILSLLIPMSLQVMIVGQMEYILLLLILITMHAIDRKYEWVAGLVLPFLWTKPHLLIIFTFFAFWRSGKRTILISAGATFLMLIVETLIRPGWHLEMLALLRAGQQRTDGLEFTTLPSLLGSRENWVGTANWPFTLALILIAFLIVWKFRSLPTIPLLSLALTASVFCAPRAYAYDLPLLIPSLIWLTAKEFRPTLWIWLVAVIFPPLNRFSAETYLVVLFVFVLSIYRANRDLHDLQHRTQLNSQYTT